MTVSNRFAVADCGQTVSPTDRFFEQEASQGIARYRSRTYQQRRNLVLTIVADELSKLKRSPAQCTALDFGCGTGVLAEDLCKMGISVTGVDRSRAMIEAAQSRLRLSRSVRLELLRDELRDDKTYLRCSYDLILCLSVLEFIVNPEEIIVRLAGLLAAGGLLILTVPNRNSYLRRLEYFGFRHPKLSRWIPSLNHLGQPDCYLHHQRQQFAAESLVRSASSLGLELEQRRFHVAPKLCGPMERLENVGMMILLSFRKWENMSNIAPGADSAFSGVRRLA